MRWFLLFSVLGALSLAQTVTAQETGADNAFQAVQVPQSDVPICSAGYEGRLSCQANRVCSCVYERAVPARGLPDRWHWDCSITRPQCEQPAADGGDYLDPSHWPLIIDRRGQGDKRNRRGWDDSKDKDRPHKGRHPNTPD